MFKGNIRLFYTKNKFEELLNNQSPLYDFFDVVEKLRDKYAKSILDKNCGTFYRKYYKEDFNERYEDWIKEKEDANSKI